MIENGEKLVFLTFLQPKIFFYRQKNLRLRYYDLKRQNEGVTT